MATEEWANAAAGVPPVFVVGMPRSGTTLLARLLESGASYTALPESHFFARFIWTSVVQRPITGLDAAWDAFARSRRWHLATRFEDEEPLRRGGPVPERYRRVFLGWVQRELAAADVDIADGGWIENTPAHLEGLPFIRHLFPDARVIGMVRDPRAVQASIAEVDWNRARPAGNAERWRWYGRTLNNYTREDPEHIRTITYESLVRHPEQTMNELAHWLGIPFDASALGQIQSTSHGFHASNEPWKRRALQPPDPARIDAWKKVLSDADIARVEQGAWPEAGLFGYQQSTGDLVRVSAHDRFAMMIMRSRLVLYSTMTRLRVAAWHRCGGRSSATSIGAE